MGTGCHNCSRFSISLSGRQQPVHACPLHMQNPDGKLIKIPLGVLWYGGDYSGKVTTHCSLDHVWACESQRVINIDRQFDRI